MDATAIIAYVDEFGQQHECSLEEAARLPLHLSKPVRTPKSHRKQSSLPGLYWFATTGEHVFYESLLEMRTLRMLDFEADVAAVSAQPFCIAFNSKKKPNFHTPDYFVRCLNGPDRVLDVKPAHRAARPSVKRVFDLTKGVCAEVGWRYEVVTGFEATFEANIRWLTGFRRRPAFFAEITEAVLDAVAGPRESEAATVGGVLRDLEDDITEALVRPVLFHLLWLRVLVTEFDRPLSNTSLLHISKGVRNAVNRR